MSGLTFFQMLKFEIGRLQAAHPEREAELARACALIANGMVLPSHNDPEIGVVLSSDMEKVYRVNGVCDCTAGAHGRDCKHLHAWKLHKYVTKKMVAQEPQEDHQKPQADSQVSRNSEGPSALPEAPVSANCHITVAGRQVQLTLRGTSEEDVLARLEKVLQRYPVEPKPQTQDRGKEWCKIHNTMMKEHRNDKGTWFSHYFEGKHCKGR
jgi:hypothetical protein